MSRRTDIVRWLLLLVVIVAVGLGGFVNGIRVAHEVDHHARVADYGQCVNTRNGRIVSNIRAQKLARFVAVDVEARESAAAARGARPIPGASALSKSLGRIDGVTARRWRPLLPFIAAELSIPDCGKPPAGYHGVHAFRSEREAVSQILQDAP